MASRGCRGIREPLGVLGSSRGVGCIGGAGRECSCPGASRV